jgi:BirA family biotin operon repressor/biotin-[acetyl-CoA-carboxylase] ligase
MFTGFDEPVPTERCRALRIGTRDVRGGAHMAADRSADLVEAMAGMTRFTDLRWVSETGSTNADLMTEALGGAPDGVVLVADYQTAGRGRLDRRWVAPPGASLLVSVLVRPALSVEDVHLVTTAMALAAAVACEVTAGVSPDLKWPNDLLEPGGSRKLGGILAESVVHGAGVDAVVVGLGLNVDWPAETPSELTDLAVALSHLSDRVPDRVALLAAMLRDLDRTLGLLHSPEGRAELVALYRRRCATVGRWVRVERVDSVVAGRAVDVTDSGHLVVEVDRERIEVVVGDVVHLRDLER